MVFNIKIIFRILGIVGIIIGLSMIIPLMLSYSWNHLEIASGFFTPTCITLILSALFIFMGRGYEADVHVRDGFLIVSLCWLFTAFVGAMPYLYTGFSDSFIDSFFESTSAFTTTNATVLDLDIMPKELMLWRSICNWLGGMGIIILALSILPKLGIGGHNLAKTEIPGASLNNLTSSAANFSKILYFFYIGFTIILFLMLSLGPMGNFEAIINTLSGISTSGLSVTKYGSLLQGSLYYQIVISVFSIIASLNFIIFFFVFQKNWKAIISNAELKFFLLLLSFSSIAVALGLHYKGGYSLIDAFKYGIFQTISISTTSGFWVTDINGWPAITITVLAVLMIIGGCSFSTSGSIKVIRILVMMKLVKRGFSRRLHPRSVVAVKVGGEVISAQRVSYTTVFILLFFIIMLFGSFLLSLENLDLLTTLSSSLAMLSNTGLGMGVVSTGDFSVYGRPLRIVLAFLMFAGRLELFSMILLFLPSFWNTTKNRVI